MEANFSLTKIYVYIKKGEDVKVIESIIDKVSRNQAIEYTLYTDSNRDYIALKQLKNDLEKEKGLLLVSSINNLGSNKQDVFKELCWLKNHHIETVFADFSTSQIFDNPTTNHLVLSVIVEFYASLLDNKAFDIRPTLVAATGRKKITFPDNWETLYAAWENGNISAKEFMEKSGLKKGTFYHLINEYKDLLEINKNTMRVG